MKDQINNQINHQTNYQIKAKKRNGFWTFCFSFVPGCAEMYWGFMQAGMSLLLPFVGVIFLAYFFSTDELMFVDVVIYIYAFFHARNMAHMTEEEVRATEDGSVNLFAGLGINAGMLKKRQTAKLGGFLMIVYGVYELLVMLYRSTPFPDWLNYYFRNFLHSFPKGATAVVLIILGVKLIAGKKQELEQETIREESASDAAENIVRETMKETAKEAARIAASEAAQEVAQGAPQPATLTVADIPQKEAQHEE